MPLTIPDFLVILHNGSGANVGRQALAREARRGGLVRIKRGAYAATPIWNSLTPQSQHLARIHAFSASHPGVVFSHESAALLHDLPLVGPIPREVQVVAQRASGGRSEPGLHRRSVGIADAEVDIMLAGSGDGSFVTITATSVSRTVADLALSQPFRFAVAPLDRALRLGSTTKAQLLDSLDSRESRRGIARATRLVEFGDPLSMNPGESLSRAVIHELGFPAPLLQVRHRTPAGKSFYTDLEWPDYKLIGEFDGRGKYLKEEYLDGLTPGEAVYQEKRREDFLRGEGSTVIRWEWNDAWARHPLGALLREAGLPVVRPPLRIARR